MATKVTIESFNESSAGVFHKLWVVASKQDAQSIESFQHGGVVLRLSNGDGLDAWTPAKGVGNWDGVPLQSMKVLVVFPAQLRIKPKVEKFLADLQAHVVASGGGLTVLDIPNGVSVAEAFKGAHGGNIKRYIEDLSPSNEAADGDDETLFERTHADYLYEIAEKSFYFCRSQEKDHFLIPKTAELPNHAYMVGEADLRNFLYRQFRIESGNIAGQSGMAGVMEALHGECAGSQYKMETALRTAKVEENYWMDLGTEDGAVIRFNAEGWEVFDRMPNDAGVAFRRSDATAPLPRPAAIAEADAELTLKKLMREFVNVSDEEWPLLVAYMVTHLIPGYKRPIMLLTSEAQSGKTTATAAVKFAVEGLMDRGKEIPAKPDDIAVTMSSERMTVYNNISGISPGLSDFLCQVVDGSTYSKRRLRTDSDMVQLKLVSSIIMNGIDTGELRSDFKTRTVRVGLKPVEGPSMGDSQIDQALIEAHPQILGSLLALAVGVLKRIPELEHPGNAFRMLDYTRVLMAIDQMWKLDGASLIAYKASLDEMSADALEDPLFATIRKMVVQSGNRSAEGVWEAEVGAKDLLAAHNSGTWSDAMNSTIGIKHEGIKNGSALTAQLNRAKTDWKRLGVTFEKLGQVRMAGGKQSAYAFRFTGDWADVEVCF